MKLINTLSLLCLVCSSSAFAKNYMAVIGGGGEPAGSTTIFDSGLKNFSRNLNQTNWQYEMSFNGGHAETQKIMKEQYSRSTKTSDFTPESYRALINSYKEKILFGEIKPGDQFVMIINSHGAQNNGNDQTHKIAASGKQAKDLNNLSDANLVSLDDLAELTKLASDRGITMGVVDLSCHSGSTLKLKNPNTCVISASGPNHYAFAGSGTFMDKFLGAFTPGTTMEQAFLKARAEAYDASYPMISTEEGESITRDIYNSISPYLYYYRPNEDKMTDYLKKNSKDHLVCQRDVQFKDLIKKIDDLKKLIPNSRYADKLKIMLESYKEIQDDLLKKLRSTGGQNLDKEEKFVTPVAGSSRPLSITLSWKNLILEDSDKWIASYSAKLAKEKIPSEKAYYQAQIEHHKKIRRKKEEILFQYPDIKDYEKTVNNMTKAMNENRNTAEQIAREEKKLYDDLYKMRQGLNFNDPCRKIKM